MKNMHIKIALLATISLSFPQLVFAKASPHHKAAHAKAASTRTAPWNSATSDLESDPSIIYGELPNGMRYAIKRNDRPQNQVIVRFAVDFGSAGEKDSEQGLAHFIEHMAFNGSSHVREGEMVKMLERLGLAFGADTNASTGFTQTIYKLDLPKNTPELMDKALFLMRETASELMINPAAVDRERGVVLSEMRQGDTYRLQSIKATYGFLYPHSYYADRFPIGQKSVLENATAAQLKGLYSKWYQPDRARIVIVGPIDPVGVERAIVAQFASWRGSSKALGPMDSCTLDTKRPAEAALFTHPDVNEQLTFDQKIADRQRADNFDRALMQFKVSIAGNIIADRMARRSRKEDIPYLGSDLSFEPNFCHKYIRVGMAIAGKDGSWPTLMPMADQMVRQAAQYGFSEHEVSDQLKAFDSNFENSAKAEKTRDSGGIAEELASNEDDIISSPSYIQTVWKRLRPMMTPDAVHAEFAKWFGKIDAPQIFLTTKKADSTTSATLLAAYNAAHAAPIAAPDLHDVKAFAYTDFGPAGTIAETKTIDDLGIKTIRFANGVRLNLKHTDFEDNRIRYSLRIDGGQLYFGRSKALMTNLFNGTYVSGGLEAHDIDDLRSLLSGTTAGANIGANDDNFGTSGAVAPKDLDLQMQLLTAYLLHPAYREEALRLYERPLPEAFASLDATAESAMQVESARMMNDKDPRFSTPPLADLQALKIDDLRTALGDALLKNPLEIALVGDFDEAAAIASVAKTFGTLPVRATTKDSYDEARKYAYSSDKGTHKIEHKGQANQLAWSRRWITTDDHDQKTKQVLDLLSRVVSERLLDILREKLGATYSPSASSRLSSVYPGRGTFNIAISGDPKDLAKIESSVDEIIAEIIKAPPANDLFERARKPVLASYADWRKNNDTWIDLASVAQSRPDRLERFRKSEEMFKTITPQDIWAAAKTYLGHKADYTFQSLPAKGE